MKLAHPFRRYLWIALPLALLSSVAFAANTLPAFSSQPTPGGGTEYTLSLQTLILLTSLTFLPAALLMMTAFTRIVIVLSLLRQAIGTVQSPPTQVIVGLSLFLTFFVMSPTLDEIYQKAYLPFSQDQITFNQAIDEAEKPLRTFMLRQTREKDLSLFLELSNSAKPNSPDDIGMKALIPAYVTSELKTAFQIGFLIYIPFLIIDMVVASVLMSMGMMMISPVTVSLPFKLMLFVLVDGWPLLIGSLVKSFYV
ncbi:flagellar type III secretion system pore protein FliP [Leeia sp. TBRC 13508]|uniref:Flagellar biosynthetic protein FliP n=1 Tax=Leeia speluncae TaxID=2884804 RepID=A0ABS8D7F6_9NEIS|nr:flagellar type III secretion system pore protein FliP [Leeia speluncae]MCB6183573.1 flagellar type III secretion system pore protein FliP [Leeia speluncae]